MPQSVVERPGLAVAVALVSLVFVNSAIVANPNASTNTLLNSGTLEAYANTPIYTNDGMVFTVGAVNADAFDLTTRLQTALNAAEQAGAVVKDGWYTETGFEEWRDRLILLKKTHFYMLDGNRFNTEFFAGIAFEGDKAVTVDSSTLPDFDQLAQDYIDADGHLDLYPEAQAAGAIGAAELVEELKADRGPVTLTETIEFSRVVEALDAIGAQRTVSVLKYDPVQGEVLALPDGASIEDPKLSSFVTGTSFTEQASGVAVYNQKMLNGFTVGNEWSKSITYDRRWFYAKAVAFAYFGFGVRIPWSAEVSVSPRVIPATQPDRTHYDASISVETHDADTAFYREVGLPSALRLNGKEFPMEAGAGIGLQVRVLGNMLLNRGRDLPLVERFVYMSEDFDPPLGDTLSIPTPIYPYESSGLAYSYQLAAVGGDFRTVFGINGDAIEMEVTPHNSWNRSGSSYRSGTKNIRITSQNTSFTLPFAVDDTAAIDSENSYHFGPIYDKASYETSLDITPQARIRGTVYLSAVWNALSDINITSDWHPLFTASFDLPALGPHRGVDSKFQATHRNTRYLNRTANDRPRRQVDTIGDGLWNLEFSNIANSDSVLIEYIPDEYELVVGSISGGGVYYPADRKIIWTLKESSIPESVAYQLNAVGSDTGPKPVGSVQLAGKTREALLDARYSTNTVENKLNIYELEQRPTLEEVRDLRTGSQILSVSDGTATLQIKVQQSDDLSSWQDVSENSIQVDADAPVRFYRYIPVDPLN